MEEKVSLLAKRKSIQTVFEYCLDQRITFTVNPKGLSPEDFQIDLIINGIKQAVALGMFAKEHKFEVLGQVENTKLKTVQNNGSKKSDPKENSEVASDVAKLEQQPVTTVLNF